MRQLLVALTVLTFAACSGPTGPEGIEVPDGPLALALVSGGGQEVTVTDTLPTDIVVQVTKGGSPLPDQLVDWTVLHDNCGSPFVTTTRTDSQGQTGNRLVAGTRAWTRPDGPDVCQMEVRYALTVADTVQARVDTTVSYRVEPGVAVTVSDPGSAREGTSPLNIGAVTEDQYGNPANFRAEVDSVFTVLDTTYGTEGARTLRADREGEAVVCIRSPDSLLAVGKGVSYGDRMRFEVHGAQDTTNEYGEIQPEDCR